MNVLAIVRNPCTHISSLPYPIRRRELRRHTSVMQRVTEKGLGKISPSFFARSFSSRKRAITCHDNGTKCSRRRFMRTAGIVHSCLPKLISSHLPPRSSLLLKKKEKRLKKQGSQGVRNFANLANFCLWRRGRDLNPRKACTFNGFQDRRDKPLCHPSRWHQQTAVGLAYSNGGTVTLSALQAGGCVRLTRNGTVTLWRP